MALLVLLFLIGLVFFLVTSVFKKELEQVDLWMPLKIGAICSWIILAIMIITVLISYPGSLSNIAKMENFYERNQKIFSEAVSKFPDAVTVKTKEGTVETVRLSWDYTKEVLGYNQNLKWYKKYQTHWFFSIFVARVPDKLQFIKLK